MADDPIDRSHPRSADAGRGLRRHALSWAEWAPSLLAGLAVLLLFAAGIWLAGRYAQPIRDVLTDHWVLGVLVYFVSSALAVLLPMLSNLALVPLAVLAWGPAWSALILLAGWVAGAGLSFTLGRHAQAVVLRRLPSVQRHVQIDRLIHPRHRLLSLVLLRMTFPVDVLSYALGLFSRSTTLAENLWSTALGGAPFALLFAWLPTLSGTAQLLVFGASLLVFVLYAGWMLRRGPVT